TCGMVLPWGLGIAGVAVVVGLLLIATRRAEAGREAMELGAAIALFSLIAEWIDSAIGFQRLAGLLLTLAVAAVIGVALALRRRGQR
ncbi:MAG: hypothetical protein AB1725_09660, partial [Armatimonadota bacterium]